MSIDGETVASRPANDWDQFLATERPDIGYKQHTWWADFSEFKRKFGGYERNFIPTLDFVYDEEAYGESRKR